jgi:UDP-N-acetylglucosamine 2-epimerase (non-hydrolysing)
MKTIHLIAAARPNFMKIAPIFHSLKSSGWAIPVVVHTGQHYDHNMSGAFFEQLGLLEPDFHLGVGSGSHAEQVAGVLVAYEKLLLAERPDLVVVVGDVNSTVACSLAASKLEIPVAHVEAGLRSFDRSMPEEINRLLTDRISDLLLAPSEDGDHNLHHEGIPGFQIVRVGNVMIDSLELMRTQFESSSIHEKLRLTPGEYALTTFHRPSNVDSFESLSVVVNVLHDLAEFLPVVFPLHPRTVKSLEAHHLMEDLRDCSRIQLCEPLQYSDFMALASKARVVVTDSGGIQEETSYFGVPCLTFRDNTERPVTLTHGTNTLVGEHNFKVKLAETLNHPMPEPAQIPLWDGKAAGRIDTALKQFLYGTKLHIV